MRKLLLCSMLRSMFKFIALNKSLQMRNCYILFFTRLNWTPSHSQNVCTKKFVLKLIFNGINYVKSPFVIWSPTVNNFTTYVECECKFL